MIKINKMQLLRFTLAGSSGGSPARGQRTLRAKIGFKQVAKFRRQRVHLCGSVVQGFNRAP